MNEFINNLKDISSMLEPGKELIDEEKVISFEHSVETLASNIDSIAEEGRNLRLGIVGEVKAGKSSFLNAMLFDGEDILPKAPTPMTAALTRIGYSENPSAKIHFYSENDWNVIDENYQAYNRRLKQLYEEYCKNFKKKQADNAKRQSAAGVSSRYPQMQIQLKSIEEFEQDNLERIPAEYKACKEVYDMTMQRLPNFREYLGQVVPIEGDANDTKSYLKSLNDYVGSDGKFNSIVKYTEIKINNKMLEGVEIIDTPGLNDPIISRSRTTREFLIECDAVFLISYCGQFLGAEDMSFIISSLPNEGIKKAVLIGSKLDSAILQYPGKPTFKSAYLGTCRNCENQAKTNLDDCQVTPGNQALVEQIRGSLPPTCVSSLAYSAALQIKASGTVTGDAEKYMVHNFKRRFEDFKDDYYTLLGLSNIPDVKDKIFAETRADKEKLINERINGIYDSQRAKFSGMLEEMIIQAKSNRDDLKKYDRDELQSRLDKSIQSLDNVRLRVKGLFDSAAVESRWKIKDIDIMVRKELDNHNKLAFSIDRRITKHTKTSGILWWKKTTVTPIETITNTAAVGDVEVNLKQYKNRCLEIVVNNFRSMLKIDKLKNDIKDTVIGAFDMSDRNFDEASILIPLETSLAEITLPDFDLNMDKYYEMLDSMLVGIVSGGVAKGERIHDLKRAQNKVLDEISEDAVALIDAKGNEIAISLENQGANFVDNITKQLEENIRKLSAMIDEKEKNLLMYDTFISNMQEAKKTLHKVG